MAVGDEGALLRDGWIDPGIGRADIDAGRVGFDPVGHGCLKMVREAGWFRKGLCMAAGWERAWRRGVALRAVRRRGGRGELLEGWKRDFHLGVEDRLGCRASPPPNPLPLAGGGYDRQSTRLNSSHYCASRIPS